MEQITSRKNPIVAEFRRLADKREARWESGLFLAQGCKLLEEALLNGAEVDTVLYAGEPPVLPATVCTYAVHEDLLSYISPMKSAPELVFTCRIPKGTTALSGKILLGENLQDPGNVGTMIRTAAAFGFQTILLAGDCADPWGPKAVRASMGAVFRVNIRMEPDPAAAVKDLNTAGIPVYAAALREDNLSAGSFRFPADFALAIGNEGHGLSPLLLSAANHVVKIPMSPGAESLNAAAAAAVLMWESWRGCIYG